MKEKKVLYTIRMNAASKAEIKNILAAEGIMQSELVEKLLILYNSQK